jgi:DNA-binding PucR family transcriptional regulator
MDQNERLRDLIAHFAQEPDWLPQVAQAMTDAVHEAVPELYEDEEIAVGTLAEIESILRQFLYMVQNGIPPKGATLPPVAAAQTRQFVRRGATLDLMLRSYQASHAAFFREWARAARDRIDDPAEVVEALELGALWTFEYLEVLSTDGVIRFRAEEERWIRSAAAIRRETVEAVLAGEESSAEVAGRRLGYALDLPHLAFVVWVGDGEPPSEELLVELEAAAEGVATAIGSGRPLIVALGGRSVAGWVVPGEGVEEVEILGAGSAVRVAVGEPGGGIDGFRRSHEEAVRARRVAELSGAPGGSVTFYRDIATVALSSVDEEGARDFVIREVGPLLAPDEAHATLARTLLTFLEEGMSARRAARRLDVHENTVANRIRAAEELLGRSVEERAADLDLALRLAPVVGHRSSSGIALSAERPASRRPWPPRRGSCRAPPRARRGGGRSRTASASRGGAAAGSGRTADSWPRW